MNEAEKRELLCFGGIVDRVRNELNVNGMV